MAKEISQEIISAAIQGFEHQKHMIDTQIAELRAMMSGNSAPAAETVASAPGKTRRKMSAAARKRISEAQRQRWSKSRGQATASAPATKKSAKSSGRQLSAAGRAAIVASLKKRWAAKKAEAATSKR